MQYLPSLLQVLVIINLTVDKTMLCNVTMRKIRLSEITTPSLY